jgi:hypothetical protein
MPRSTALMHFLTARAPEPYRIGPALLTTRGEGTPSDAGHGLVLVVDRGVIHLIIPAASSGTPGHCALGLVQASGGHRWTMTHSLRIGCVAVLRCRTAQLGYPSTDACAGDSSCASTRGCIPSVSVGVTAKTDLVALLGLGVSRCSQLRSRSRHLNGLATQGLSARLAVAATFPARRSTRSPRTLTQRCANPSRSPSGFLRSPLRISAAAPPVRADRISRHGTTAHVLLLVSSWRFWPASLTAMSLAVVPSLYPH